MNPKLKVLMILAVLWMTVFLSPVRCFAQSCDVEEFIEKYSGKYDKCEELVEETKHVADICMKDMDRWEISGMATLFLKCGYHDEALPFLREQRRNPFNGYNSAFLLEAMLLSDEDEMVKEALQPFYNSQSAGDLTRLYSYAYMGYGDFEKAISILEAALENEPQNLRIANALQNVYLYAADFEKAAYYAKYYNDGDKRYYQPYITYAKISFYQDDYDGALKNLNEVRQHSEGADNFTEAWLHIVGGSYDEAIGSLKKYKSLTSYVDRFSENVFELDFADFYIDLIGNEGSVPEADILLERAESLTDEEDYYSAGMYYYLLTMIQPEKKEYNRDLAYMMELSGDMYVAARKYSLYLALVPDAEDRDDALAFLASRKSNVEMPAFECRNYFEENGCIENSDCYWNTDLEQCLEKDMSCVRYKTMDACSSVPLKSGCYWNTGMMKCLVRNKPCYSYNDSISCNSAPFDKQCIWSPGSNRCVEQR